MGISVNISIYFGFMPDEYFLPDGVASLQLAFCLWIWRSLTIVLFEMFVACFPKNGRMLQWKYSFFFFLKKKQIVQGSCLEGGNYVISYRKKRGDEGLFNIVMKERKKAVLHSHQDHFVKTILS